MVVLSTLLMPAMVIRFYQGWFQMLLIDFPLFMASTFSISSFYLVSQKELIPGSGIGLSVPAVSHVARHRPHRYQHKSGSRSTPRHKSSFKRTPKYRVEKRGEKSHAAKYRKRLGIIPWIELLIGCYFALTIWYAITNENYFTVPFLLLFVVGYWYTGLLSLLQGRFERWRTGGANLEESSPKPFPVGV